MFAHIHDVYPTLYKLASVVIPVFFLMSGFLCARGFSKERVFRQVRRYGIIYLVIEFFVILWFRILVCQEVGYFNWPRFGVNLLKCFVCYNDRAIHLWFMPALLYPMLLNAFLDARKRKVVIAIAAAVYIFNSAGGSKAFLLPLFDSLTTACPSFGKVFSSAELLRMWGTYTVGLLYTTIGFDIADWKIKPSYYLLAAVPFAVFDLSVHYIGVAVIFLSLAFFYWVKGLPGKFMYPYHLEISLFSGAMYFLHLFEKRFIIRFITDNIVLNLLIIIAFNLFLALAISYFVRRKDTGTEPTPEHGLQ